MTTHRNDILDAVTDAKRAIAKALTVYAQVGHEEQRDLSANDQLDMAFRVLCDVQEALGRSSRRKPQGLERVCRHCDELILLGKEGWHHISGPGGYRFCTYQPDSPIATPTEELGK